MYPSTGFRGAVSHRTSEQVTRDDWYGACMHWRLWLARLSPNLAGGLATKYAGKTLEFRKWKPLHSVLLHQTEALKVQVTRLKVTKRKDGTLMFGHNKFNLCAIKIQQSMYVTMDHHASREEEDQHQTKMSVSASAMIPPPSSASSAGQALAMANVKYRNEAGRQAILAAAEAVNHDFGLLCEVLNVSIGQDDLARLAADSNIAWVDREGAVHFIRP
jgi:hypothetical protein